MSEFSHEIQNYSHIENNDNDFGSGKESKFNLAAQVTKGVATDINKNESIGTIDQMPNTRGGFGSRLSDSKKKQ